VLLSELQWGEWLRASPRKNQKPPPAARPSVSSSSFSNRLGGGGVERFGGGVSIRDLPPRRNLNFNQVTSSSSCTGGGELRREGGDEVSSPAKNHGARAGEVGSGKEPMEIVSKKSKGGMFIRKPHK
jgi:hypothetical protein